MSPALFLFALTLLASAQEYKGVWWWTWSSSLSGDVGSLNMAIAFSGWTDPNQALADSASKRDSLPGQKGKFLSLGGGNANGHWSAAYAYATRDACNQKRFGGYDGIAFDIEEGDSGLTGPFREAFAACKNNGYKVLVTVSHSAPYGVGDAAALMRGFFSDSNIDFLSPQMYTTGTEGGNDFATVAGIEWREYASSRAVVIPSIVSGNMYEACKRDFQSHGVNIQGYIQWSQTVTAPSGGGGNNNGNQGGNSGCPSADECKSRWGYCGKGNDYCGEGCQGGPCNGAPVAAPVAQPVPVFQPVPVASASGCPEGDQCKSKWGYCGKGADFCGEGCQGGPCWGGGNGGANGCPVAGQCRSRWGYCGFGPEYCNNQRLEESSDNSGLSSGALAGVIVGAIVGAMLLIGLIVFAVWKVRSDSKGERF